jgi:endonuclease/exonuclease/phosphatase (EEP) superfamily protein YafD
MWRAALILAALIYCDVVNAFYVVATPTSIANGKKLATSKTEVETIPQSTGGFQYVKHRTGPPVPKVKNLLKKVSFSWAQNLMEIGNKRPLELKDIWTLPEKNQMEPSSEEFISIYNQQKQNSKTLFSSSTNDINIFMEFTQSPLTKSIYQM